MQCDPHCSEYSACIPSCPLDTCDNTLDQAKDQRLCNEDTCVEGCKLKPCPEGEIYKNDSYIECVPKSVCKPICLQIDGKPYYEGDVTKSDNCQTCHCSKGKQVCIGIPCAPTSILPHHNNNTVQDSQVNCTSGWTDWLNQDKLGIDVKSTKANTKTGDVEPLPSEVVLKNSNQKVFCSPTFMKQIECRTTDTRANPKKTGEDVECSLEKGLICVGQCHDYEIRVMCDCEDNIDIFTPPVLEPHIPPPVLVGVIQATTTEVVPVDVVCDPTRPHVEFPGDCYKFLHCQQSADGSWRYVEKTCGPDMMFQPNSMTCDYKASVVNIKPLCAETTTVQPLVPAVTIPAAVVIEESKCPPEKLWSDCAVPCGRACHYYGKYLQTMGLCTGRHNSCEKGCVPKASAVTCPPDHFWRDDKVCVKAADCTCKSENGKIVKVCFFT